MNVPAVVAACTAAAGAAGADSCRLFHGRGRLHAGFEHVAVDWFPPLALVTLYRPLPEGMLAALLEGLVPALAPAGMGCLAVQERQGGGEASFRVVHGELPPVLQAREAGLGYRIDPARGQNLGFFPDMAVARDWLRVRAAGRRVLNLFAFTCAFSVAARAGGAARVVNIDLSRPSLATGRANHVLNGLSLDDIFFLDHDIFRSWKKLHALGRYDIVVLDPPSAQKGSFTARKDYAKVVRRLPKLLAQEGDVLACLNDPALGEDFLDAVFAAELPGAQKVARLPNPPAYADADPQAALKVVHYRYRRPDTLPALGEAEEG